VLGALPLVGVPFPREAEPPVAGDFRALLAPAEAPPDGFRVGVRPDAPRGDPVADLLARDS